MLTRNVFFLVYLSLLFNAACQKKVDFLVKDVAQPVIDLNGTWNICFSSYENILDKDQYGLRWDEIEVPGECMMQGFPIKHNHPFTYKREFRIPADFKGKLIKIRFEGVYSYARVWVNGKYICDHSGGFTAWECDISQAVEPGKPATIIVEVTDRSDEISYASGYAKHPIGGILRSVSLMALPYNYPELLSITTDLDEKYMNAILTVEGITKTQGDGCNVELELYDCENKKIDLQLPSAGVNGSGFKISNLVLNPLKWDAEHPELYRLKVSFEEKGMVVWQKNYYIGFREIEVQGKKFLVNGRQIKLRGVCRHDIHPLLGRISTPEYDLKDVLLAREANINFIRTSHYPPSEKFLEYCDRYGIYVEDEAAVCFVGSHRTAEYYPGSSENSPDFTDRYLSQLREMVNNHRNHASVIIWSIGNENFFGSNFKKSYDWIKNTDPTRPVIFSYPGMVPDSIRSFDILSMHYPGIKGDMNQYGIITSSFSHEKTPVVFDEWAHVACYNHETVKEDPNIRDFWGISLDSMWQRTFDADGGLGGAIWGMIDETFMLPEDLPGYNEWWGKLDKNVIPGKYTGHTIGYGEWGIIDVWRRKKPEFWNVTKAYSPIRVLGTEINEYIPGEPVEIPVYNRFDFTNLNEITINLTLKGKTKSFNGPDIPPHTKGNIIITLDELPECESVNLEFTDRSGRLIDSYSLSGHSEAKTASAPGGKGTIELTEEDNEYLIICDNNNKISIDKSTGLFKSFENSSGRRVFTGPYVNIRSLGRELTYSSHFISDLCTDWRMDTLSIKKEENYVNISVKGKYTGNIAAEFSIQVYPDVTITLTYSINDIPEGKLREAGIRYVFEDDFDTLKWKRIPYWSKYPAGHLSEPEGNVPLFSNDNKTYRKAPGKEWQHDKKSFFYDGTGDETGYELTNAARATKENVIEYNLAMKGPGNIIVYGDGKDACRIEQRDGKIILSINNEVDYPDLSWGNYYRNISLQKSYKGKVRLAVR